MNLLIPERGRAKLLRRSWPEWQRLPHEWHELPKDPAQVMDLIDKRQRDRHALVIDAKVVDEVMN